MELTGDAKKEFEQWYCENNISNGYDKEHIHFIVDDYFYKHPFCMQFGMYVDFFETQGLFIEIKVKPISQFNYRIHDDVDWVVSSEFCNDRDKVRVKAIEKANNMHNGL